MAKQSLNIIIDEWHYIGHSVPMRKAKERIARFVDIDLSTGCWNWTGCVQANGYARITFERKSLGAHRLSYTAYVGSIPTGHDVCHKCDNRKCVNPAHLFVGTRKANMEDAVAKSRQARAERLPQTKIPHSQYPQLMAMVRAEIPYRVIAVTYGVTPQLVGKIAIKQGVRRNAKQVLLYRESGS